MDDTIKLYEYPEDKPDLSEEFLEHHGILGMHWGQRNGPPYPLSKAISTGKSLRKKVKKKAAIRKAKKTRKRKKQELENKKQLQKSKDEVIKSRDIEAMLANVGQYSNQEINDVLNRLDTEDKLKQRVKTRREANKSTGRKMYEGAKSSIKKGLSNSGQRLLTRASENALEIGVKKFLKEASSGNDELATYFDELLKERKKK